MEAVGKIRNVGRRNSDEVIQRILSAHTNFDLYIFILSVFLDLLIGYTGILSVTHAAFYGIGAYVAALMALNLNSPFLLNLILAVIAAVILGAIVGIPSLRIKDDYFVIATFAFQIITFSILNNLVDFTGGPLGLPGIPQPVIFGIEISSHISFLILSGILAAFAYLKRYSWCN